MRMFVRSAVVLFLLHATTLQAGEVFPLGSGEIDARSAGMFDVARTRQGSIVAWSEWRAATIKVTRLDRNGALVGTTKVRSQGYSLEIASTGREALLIEGPGSSKELFARRIDGEAVAEAQLLPIRAFEVLALEWTGSAYALLFRDADRTLAVALLGRDGVPVSGILRYPRSRTEAALLACGDERCLIAFPEAQQGQIAVIGEEDFPSPSQQARGAVLTFPMPGRVRDIGFDEELGFYSVAGGEVRRHGRLRGISNELLTPSRTIALPEIPDFSRVVTASHGGTVYLAYHEVKDWHYYTTQLAVLRVTRGGQVETLDAGPEAFRRAPVQFIVHQSVALVWRDTITSGYYGSRVEENALRNPATPVSAGLGREIKPRILRGTTNSLVTWVEEFAARQKLYAAIVDRDGRPVSTPALLAVTEMSFGDVVVAFDGVNFLVLWKTYRELKENSGQLISQDGQLVGARIDLPASFHTYETTLVWTGSEYWTTGTPGVLRISPSGQFLENLPSLNGSGNMVLVRDEDGRLRGVNIDYESAIVSAGPQIWSIYSWVEIVETSPGRPYPSISNGGSNGQYVPRTGPAVAFGGGHRLAIFDSSGWSDGPLRDLETGAELPYPAPGWGGYFSLQIHWNGAEFIVFAGRNLARHSTTGEIRTISLGHDVTDSAGVVDGPDALLVIRERDGALEAERMILPLP